MIIQKNMNILVGDSKILDKKSWGLKTVIKLSVIIVKT